MKHFTWVNHTYSEKDPSKQIARDGKHFYETPEGKEYPSVTAMVYYNTDKTGLDIWKKRIGESVAKYIFEEAGKNGTAVHSTIESYLRNDFKQPKPLLTKGHFAQIQPLLEKIDNIRACEIGLYSHNMKLGGMADCIAEHNGVLSVIDFKTSRKKKYESNIEGYFIQATCYALMWEELTGERIERIVIMITCEDGTVQEFVKNPSNYTERLHEKVREFNKR